MESYRAFSDYIQTYIHTVLDMKNLNFAPGIRDCPLLAYANDPKENHGYSLRIRASYMVFMHEFVRKMAVRQKPSNNGQSE